MLTPVTRRTLMIAITVHRCSEPPSASTPSITQTLPLRVLPTMSLRTFRLKIAKSLGLRKAEQITMKLWLTMPGSAVASLDETQDTQDLSWLGLEDASEVLVYV